MESDSPMILVAVDFSECSKLALRKARALIAGKPGRIIALHVIDREFVGQCIRHRLGDEGIIKKKLFLEAKARLLKLLGEEGMTGDEMEVVVCEGIPFIEINRKAIENDADMIIMGSCGNAGDMNTIFFGSTAEKVLRFITRPVLCVPPGRK
jgi:nucleotide-binding universal stress UspA family protein